MAETAESTALKTAQSSQDVWKVIQGVLSDLTSLKITTVITGGDSTRKLELCTCIDLLQADRTNTIDESFLKDPALAPLHAFHKEQVALAVQEAEKRIEFLEKLGKAIVDAINAARGN